MELKQLAKKAADLTQLDCPKDTPSDPPIDAPGDPTMDTSCDPPIESMPLAFAAALNLSPSKVPSAQAAETVTQQSPDFTEVMVPQKKQKKRKRVSYCCLKFFCSWGRNTAHGLVLVQQLMFCYAVKLPDDFAKPKGQEKAAV